MGWWTRSSRLILVATVIPPSTSWAGCGGQINPTDAPATTDGAARRGDGGADADNVADGTAPGDDGGDSIQITCLSPNSMVTGKLATHTSGDVLCIPAGIGLQLDCIATATYADGTTGDVSATAAWQSSAPATALPSGLVTMGTATQPYETFTINGAGSAEITATQGTAVSNTITTSAVTESLKMSANECAGSGPLAVVTPMGTCSPGSPITPGATALFTVIASYTTTGTCTASESSFNVTSLATWSTVNPAIATVSDAGGSKGLVTGVSAGTTGLAATFGGQADTFNVTVF
jgi:hypothetical protein